MSLIGRWTGVLHGDHVWTMVLFIRVAIGAIADVPVILLACQPEKVL